MYELYVDYVEGKFKVFEKGSLYNKRRIVVSEMKKGMSITKIVDHLLNYYEGPIEIRFNRCLHVVAQSRNNAINLLTKLKKEKQNNE